jgi:hypothetical protein
VRSPALQLRAVGRGHLVGEREGGVTSLGDGLAHTLDHARPDDLQERTEREGGRPGRQLGVGKGGKLDQVGLAF